MSISDNTYINDTINNIISNQKDTKLLKTCSSKFIIIFDKQDSFQLNSSQVTFC